MGATVIENMGRKPEIDFEEGVGRATRSLYKSGSSTVVAIPPDLLSMLQWEEGDEVEMEAEMGTGEITLRLEDGDSDEE